MTTRRDQRAARPPEKRTGPRGRTGNPAPDRAHVSRSPKATPRSSGEGAAAVDAFLATLAHPQRDLVAAIRAEMRRVAPELSERVKWNAPSTYLGKADLSAFNLRAKGFVQLVLLFPRGVVGDDTGILEGEWADRRFVRFVDEADFEKKRTKLGEVLRAWIAAQG